MTNVPLALIGGIFALWLSGQYLSVPSSIGFIALFGVAVLNGVVMVTSINRRFTENRMLKQAIEEGAHSRLRPVLMTALTTALGLIPLLLATGVGSEIQRPMATVVVGGLVSSTLLTLLVIPALYPWVFSTLGAQELKSGITRGVEAACDRAQPSFVAAGGRPFPSIPDHAGLFLGTEAERFVECFFVAAYRARRVRRVGGPDGSGSGE